MALTIPNIESGKLGTCALYILWPEIYSYAAARRVYICFKSTVLAQGVGFLAAT
jgi:hypothetical protein